MPAASHLTTHLRLSPEKKLFDITAPRTQLFSDDPTQCRWKSTASARRTNPAADQDALTPFEPVGLLVCEMLFDLAQLADRKP